MLKILRRHWRGENGPWVSLLCCTLLVTAIVFFAGARYLGSISPDTLPSSRIYMLPPAFLIVAAAGIWQLVGTWRATSRARASTNFFITRWFMRLLSLAVCLGCLAMLTMLPSMLGRLQDMMADRDHFGLAGNNVEIDDTGTNLIISGYFSWGLLQRVETALNDNPSVDTVILNSPGGHVGVGRKLASMFTARHLDTAVLEMCASACTFALSGGVRRIAARNARIGFHAESGDNEHTLELSRSISKQYWLDFGLPEDFIQKANDTPADDIWFPSLQQLQQLNLVTELIR